MIALPCEHLNVSMYTNADGEEMLYCLDCLQDLGVELPELTPAQLADQLAETEE